MERNILDGVALTNEHVDHEHAQTNGHSVRNGGEVLIEGKSEHIALIGMACRLPGGASSPKKLWNMLLQERSGAGDIPKSRFNIDAYYHPDLQRPGSINNRGGYFIDEDVRSFENSFFGISNIEATYMDPQQRKLLEVVYESLESAGITLDDVSGANVGVYVGSFTTDYIITQGLDTEYLHRYSGTGMSTSILANRISHAFNMCGPSLVVDTACSSSLCCLHMACAALRAGECDTAIVAGVNIIGSFQQYMGTAKAGVLSPTSTCHTFDSLADGYARADGVGALVLKRIEQAVESRDPIRVVISGSAINSNGKTLGISMPSSKAQEAVIRKAYRIAGIENFEHTGYVECHGTGTQAGDPIEVAGISNVFTKGVLIGAIKPNLGHSEAASGISGVIKVALSIENNIIPATIGIKQLNPKIDFDASKLNVVQSNTAWPKNNTGVRRAGINSFGFGGANAHVILESIDSVLPEYSKSQRTHLEFPISRQHFLLPVSASTEAAFKIRAIGLQEAVSISSPNIIDLAYTLGSRRTHHRERGYVVSQQNALADDLKISNLNKFSSKISKLPLVYVFTGQGAQWQGMGKELIQEFSIFRTTIQELDKVLLRCPEPPSWRLENFLLEEDSKTRYDSPEISQPVCTAVQIGIVSLLQDWGLKPEVVLGHSSGEIAAAFAAGYLNAEQAILVAYYRGFMATKCPLQGKMLAAGIGKQAALEILKDLNLQETVNIACFNSQENVTFSGDIDGIDRLQTYLDLSGIFNKILKTGGLAYHSHQMKTIGEQYQQKLSVLDGTQKSNPSKVRFISTMRGGEELVDLPSNPTYWHKNLVSPVRFEEAIRVLHSSSVGLYEVVEIGPHWALKLPINQIHKDMGLPGYYHATLQRGKNSILSLLDLAGRLFCRGHKLNFDRVNIVEFTNLTKELETRQIVCGSVLKDLPTYPWTYERMNWYEPAKSIELRNRLFPHHGLLGSLASREPLSVLTWCNKFSMEGVGWLKDHKLKLESSIVFPATAYLGIAEEALQQALRKRLPSLSFTDVKIIAPLTLFDTDEVPIELFTVLQPKSHTAELASTTNTPETYSFEISSLIDKTSTIHCRGVVSAQAGVDRESNLPSLCSDEIPKISPKIWYERFAEKGLNYGLAFRPLQNIRAYLANGLQYIVKAEVPILQEYSMDSYPADSFMIHPITLDACLQACLVATCNGNIRNLIAKLPISIERCDIYRPGTSMDRNSPCTIEASSELQGFGRTNVSATLTNQRGEHFVRITNVTVQDYDIPTRSIKSDTGPLEERSPICQVSWRPDPTLLSEMDPLSVEKYLSECSTDPHIAAITGSCQFSKFLYMLDCILHKKPAMKILDLGESISKTRATLKLVDYGDTFKRCRQYFVGYLDLARGIIQNEVCTKDGMNTTLNPGNATAGENTPVQFIIIPDTILADTYLRGYPSLLNKLMEPGGTLLTPTVDDNLLRDVKKTLHNWNFWRVDSLLYATKLWEGPVNGLGNHIDISSPIFLVEYNDSLEGSVAVGAVQKLLTQKGKDCVRISLSTISTETIPPRSTVISFIEMSQPVLSKMNSIQMTSIKYIIDKTRFLLWITGTTDSDPEFAVVKGLSRALLHEHPDMKFCILEMDEGSVDHRCDHIAKMVDILLRQISTTSSPIDRDLEFLERRGLLHVSRFHPNIQMNECFRQSMGGEKVLATLEHIFPACLSIERPGIFDTLYFEKVTHSVNLHRKPLQEDWVEIRVAVFGLNAKDVYVLGGRVDTPGRTRSLEFTGIVENVGSGVVEFSEGDRVVAMAPGHFGQLERVPKWACHKLIDDEDFTIMASLPVVYSTALLALNHRARLRKGESVLIHSGAGGVGLAAIELAQITGAVIFTTVGSEKKRKFLHKRFGIPENHIFSSRDKSFVEDLLNATAGRGVDVVLNSLSGELLHRSWSCCAKFGRFIEIGKADIVGGGQLDMKVFAQGASFSAFDLSEYFYENTEDSHSIIQGLLSDCVGMYRLKCIKPIKPTVHNASDITTAFRDFTSRNRVGKIVIDMQNSSSLVRTDIGSHATYFNPNKHYLIVGGLGGLGRSLSRWMMSRGARKFVHLARSGSTKPAAKALIEELEKIGASIQVVTGDVANLEDVEKAVECCGNTLGGVIQAAMCLKEELFTTMSHDHWASVLAPKVKGTWNLHKSTLKSDQLDFFLMLSSNSGTIGTATESNYCAANSFLDQFATYRRQLGKPAVAIGLGAISGAGYLHENPDIEAILIRRGIQYLDEDEFLTIVDLALAGAQEQNSPFFLTGMESLGFRKLWAAGYDIRNPTMDDARAGILVNALQTTLGSTQKIQKKVAISYASLDDIVGSIQGRFATLILTTPESVEVGKPLSEYGMDSMIAAEFKTWLHSTFHVDIPFIALLSTTTTVRSLGNDVFKQRNACQLDRKN